MAETSPPAAKPPVSPARLAANRANAQKSTGPRTEEGKARSRENALKHGLTGQGICRTPEMEREYRHLVETYEQRFQPADEVEHGLVRAAAWGACRFDQTRRRQIDRERLRQARATFDAQARLDAAVRRLAESPADALRELTQTVAGIDWLIAAWTELRGPIDRGKAWNDDERDRALALLGLPAVAFWLPAGRTLARLHFAMGTRCAWTLQHDALVANRVYRMDITCASQSSRISTNPPSREDAQAMLLELIDDQIARLSALREAILPIDVQGVALATLADDPETRLDLRYETSARSIWNGALSRLRQLQADRRRAEEEPEERPAPAPAPRGPYGPLNPHPESLAAQLGGRDPLVMIEALRDKLRSMAKRPVRNEPNPEADRKQPPPHHAGLPGAPPRAKRTQATRDLPMDNAGSIISAAPPIKPAERSRPPRIRERATTPSSSGGPARGGTP